MMPVWVLAARTPFDPSASLEAALDHAEFSQRFTQPQPVGTTWQLVLK